MEGGGGASTTRRRVSMARHCFQSSGSTQFEASRSSSPRCVSTGTREITQALETDLDEVDVAERPLIEWQGGGPEVWTSWTSPWPTSPTAARAGTE